jgi:hypothetical protein
MLRHFAMIAVILIAGLGACAFRAQCSDLGDAKKAAEKAKADLNEHSKVLRLTEQYHALSDNDRRGLTNAVEQVLDDAQSVAIRSEALGRSEGQSDEIATLGKEKSDEIATVSKVFAGLVGFIIIGFFLVLLDTQVRHTVFRSAAGLRYMTLFLVAIALILFGLGGIVPSAAIASILTGLAGFVIGSRLPS